MALRSMIKLGRIVNKCQLFTKPSTLVSKAFLGYGWHHLRYSDERATKYDKVAIILSGCGMADGTEIFEATATATALSYAQMEPVFYASSLAFMHANNHITGDFEDDLRLPLDESGRIAGGPVKLLVELTTERAGGLILPGGFGINAALTDYYMLNTDFNFVFDVLNVLQNFYKEGRPIAFIGIAGIMAARMFPEVKMTMGDTGDIHRWPYSEAIEHAREMRAEVVLQDVGSHTYDESYGVFTTPGFMYNGSYHEIYQGINCMMALQNTTELGKTVIKRLLYIKLSDFILKANYTYGQYRFTDLRGVERNKKVAIVLTGCGILDGTDPFEATMAAHCVSESGMVPIFYATRLLFKAVDYSKKIITKKRRSSFLESARIARGELKDLCELRTTDVGAVIIPGGYGIGTTLSNYEKKHVDFQVHPHLAGIIMDFMACKIPIGFIGIAGILAARLYPQVQITLGNYGDRWPYCWAIDHAKENGAEVVLTSEYDTIVDEWYNVFSTPGFMYNGRYKDIHLGISFMVSRMHTAALWSTPEPADNIRFD